MSNQNKKSPAKWLGIASLCLSIESLRQLASVPSYFSNIPEIKDQWLFIVPLSIFGVICGHLSRSKGSNKVALAGLIIGYSVIAIVASVILGSGKTLLPTR
jgi:hypothetical protein|tara:strand:- start:277 stop:579 length:303 start_codon:yes stop_codon:yes gene_type:complete